MVRYVNRIRPLREGLRKQHGVQFSQRHLAVRLGVNERTLIRWEDGESMPSAIEAVELARELGVTVEQLGFRRVTEDLA